MLANQPLGYLEEIWAKRDDVLSTARMSPSARTRVMGVPVHLYRAPTKSVAPKTDAVRIPEDPPGTRRRRPFETSISVGAVLKAVSDVFGIEIRAILSVSKSLCFSRPRFAAALLLNEKRKMSGPSIAHCFRRASESSGWDMLDRARQLLTTDPEWAERYHAAERLLKGEK